MKTCHWLAWLLYATTFCIMATAHAQQNKKPYSWEGDISDFAVVVLVSKKEIVFDRGTNAGVKTGDKVVLYRTLTIHHPLSKEKITDKFPIGEVRVAESSELLSIIKNFKRLAYTPKAGDLVLVSPRQPAKPARRPEVAAADPVQVPCPTVPVTGISDEVKALHSAYLKSLGRSIDKRIWVYEKFVDKYPTGTYADAVQNEIAWLGALGQHMTEKNEKIEPGGEVMHSPITYLEVGDTAQVVIAIIAKQPAHGARLFLRKVGDEGFDEMPLEPTGAYYFRGVIPEQYVSKRGRFEYFIEVAFVEGKSVPKVASGANPYVVKVTTPVVDKIEYADRSVARVMFEYVNFDMDKNVDDEYWAFEADYFYRISTFLYGVRVGMGIFSGTGGVLKEIEESKDNNREAAVNYGYLEGEFEVVPMFHFMLRLAVGNHRTGDEDAMMDSVFGFEGGVRIGEELKTNLVASGAVLQQIGYEARLALEINVFKRVPINLEGLVTNYPVNDSHPGLRIVLGTGFRFTDWLAILARGSWNARTIKHTGFGGGASLALSW